MDGIRQFLDKLPALPRFSDPAQRKAGGNIVKFMAVLLALTLIARGTSGATLARVELVSPARSVIVEAISGNAVVTVRDTVDIIAPEGLTVVEMLVGSGQRVNAGDAVAVFDMDEIWDRLIREAEKLDKSLLELERLERAVDADSSSLDSAQRNLERARDDYEDVRIQGRADVDAAREALMKALDELAEDPDATALDNAWRSLLRAQDDYIATRTQGESDISTAMNALNDALLQQAESVDRTSLDTAQRSLSRAQEDYRSTKTQEDANISAAWTALSNAQDNERSKRSEWEHATDEDRAAAEQVYLAAQAETARARDALDTAQRGADNALLSAARRVEDAQTSLATAEQNFDRSIQQASDTRQSNIDKARDALDTAQKRADESLLNANRRVEDAQSSLETAEQNFKRSSQQASDNRQNNIDKARDALVTAEKRASDNLLSAARRVEDAQASLATAGENFGKSAQQSADTAAQNRLSTGSLRLDIDEQKAVVDALRLLEINEGVLYSDISGIVSAAKAEGSVTGKDALVAFMDGTKGFEAHLTLDKADAERLTVGEECEVATGRGSMFYNPTVIGIVSAVSPPDEQNRVRVTIRLPDGDWSEGQRVDVQAEQDRSTYDMCVPLSALRSDNTGYFLFTVEQTSTILGVANVVIRTPVTVLSSDDDMAAIQGPVDRSSQVIAGSNKAVAAGDRVRING